MPGHAEYPPRLPVDVRPSRVDELLRLQPVQCRVHGTDRDLAIGDSFDLPPHHHAVRLVSGAQYGEQHLLLEGSEWRVMSHDYCSLSVDAGSTLLARQAGM